VNSASSVLKSPFFVSASPSNLSKLKGSKAEASTNSFRIRTYEKCAPNSFRIRTSKNTALKVLWNPHLHKKMGG